MTARFTEAGSPRSVQYNAVQKLAVRNDDSTSRPEYTCECCACTLCRCLHTVSVPAHHAGAVSVHHVSTVRAHHACAASGYHIRALPAWMPCA